ncbi:hypothetical protein [Bordetella genomosp. 13]|uniref:hypothetical protein n=1 Tax=Bordetella genomosp. 13 TaxID=463040 RepID=UPI0011A1A688|nr:hypothetical protein [Bordetella genomosp. 13]
MSINAFNQAISQPGLAPDHALHQGDGGKIVAQEPLNPPGAWTRFKAALSNVPLLGQLGSLRQARAEVDAYPVKLAQYEASNRQVLTGFLADVRQGYGENIGGMVARDIGVADGKPLTARTVATAMQNVERQQNSYRSMNNMQITRFLENGLTGTRARGETDMMGLFLERGLKLGGHDSWQGAMGDGAARFVSQYVMRGCAELPGHSQGIQDNAQIARLAGQALDLYQELLAAPGMTPKGVDAVMARATGEDRNPAAMTALAREFVVVEHASGLLDRANPDSMLRKVETGVAREMGVATLPDAVLKSISRGMLEGLSYQVTAMPEQFGCASDATSIIKALEPRLKDQVQQVVGEHQQALRAIDTSDTLSETGKTQLRDIAQTRRMDPVQVREYGNISHALTGAMIALAEGIESGRLEHGLPQLDRALTAFEDGVGAMKQHGHEMGESVSLAGGDFTTELMDQMSSLATSSMPREEANRLLAQLTGDAGRKLAQGMQSSPDMRTAAQFPLVYMAMVEALALRAGQSPEAARELSQGTLADSVSLTQLPPSTAAALLPASGSDALDARGVVSGATVGKLVSRDFRPDQLFTEQRQDLEAWTLRDEASAVPYISKTMEKDLPRATFFVDGERLAKPNSGQDPKAQFRAHFAEGPQGDAMALAVSRCMSQVGINAFTTACQGAAFGDVIALYSDAQLDYQATSNEDGSWTVQATHTGKLAAVETTPGEPVTQIGYDNVMLNQLTFTITPPQDPQGQPTIALTGSNVVFSS